MKIVIFISVICVFLLFGDELPKWVMVWGVGYMILAPLKWKIEESSESIIHRLNGICSRLPKSSNHEGDDEDSNY